MKRPLLFLLTISMIFIASCKQKNSYTELTEQEKEKITIELRERVQKIIDNAEIGNLSEGAEVYWDNPEFIAVVKGKIRNYQNFFSGYKKFLDKLDSQEFLVSDLVFTFLANEIVIATYKGSALADFKDGKKIKIDPYTVTLVFKKIDGIWKVVYTNEFLTSKPIVSDSTNVNE